MNFDSLDELKTFVNENTGINVSVDNYIENQPRDCPEMILSNESVIKVKNNLTRQTKTFTFDEKYKNIQKFLNDKLPRKIEKLFKSSEEKTTDDLRNLIEDEARKVGLGALENCYSYTEDREKWFALNYVKRYDADDYLVGEENICFAIESGDVWHLNIELIEENENTKVIASPSNFYEITGVQSNLKLDCSKKLFKNLKNNKHVELSNLTAKDKLGLRECLDKELLVNVPCRKIKDSSIKVFVFRDTFKKM